MHYEHDEHGCRESQYDAQLRFGRWSDRPTIATMENPEREWNEGREHGSNDDRFACFLHFLFGMQGVGAYQPNELSRADTLHMAMPHRVRRRASVRMDHADLFTFLQIGPPVNTVQHRGEVEEQLSFADLLVGHG